MKKGLLVFSFCALLAAQVSLAEDTKKSVDINVVAGTQGAGASVGVAASGQGKISGEQGTYAANAELGAGTTYDGAARPIGQAGAIVGLGVDAGGVAVGAGLGDPAVLLSDGVYLVAGVPLSALASFLLFNKDGHLTLTPKIADVQNMTNGDAHLALGLQGEASVNIGVLELNFLAQILGLAGGDDYSGVFGTYKTSASVKVAEFDGNRSLALTGGIQVSDATITDKPYTKEKKTEETPTVVNGSVGMKLNF